MSRLPLILAVGFLGPLSVAPAQVEPTPPPASVPASPTAPPTTVEEYLKRFPDCQKVEPVEGRVIGFGKSSANQPGDAFYVRRATGLDLLVVADKGRIIGYLARFVGRPDADQLWRTSVKMGVEAAFPGFECTEVERSDGGDQGRPVLVWEIRDTDVYLKARDARIAAAAAKWKSLLNP